MRILFRKRNVVLKTARAHVRTRSESSLNQQNRGDRGRERERQRRPARKSGTQRGEIGNTVSQTQGQTSSADTERTLAKGSLCRIGTKEGEVDNTVSQT